MPKQRRAHPGEINGDAFDRFTAVHFASGVGLGLTPLPMWSIALLAVGWELIENPLKDSYSSAFPNATHDTTANAVVDVAAVMAGAVVARIGRGLGRGLSLGAALLGKGAPTSAPLPTGPRLQSWPRPGRRAILFVGWTIWPMDRSRMARLYTLPEVYAWLETYQPGTPIDLIDIGGAEFGLAGVENWARERGIKYRSSTDWPGMANPYLPGDRENLQRSWRERFWDKIAASMPGATDSEISDAVFQVLLKGWP